MHQVNVGEADDNVEAGQTDASQLDLPQIDGAASAPEPYIKQQGEIPHVTNGEMDQEKGEESENDRIQLIQ